MKNAVSPAKTRPPRRTFLIAAAGAAIAAAAYAIVTRRRWVAAGPVNSIPVDDFFSFESDDRKAFLRRTASGQIIALSQRCTHQGCLLAWQAANWEFHCPCHKGVFDSSGAPIAGPPRRPLERFETRIQNGNLDVYM